MDERTHGFVDKRAASRLLDGRSRSRDSNRKVSRRRLGAGGAVREFGWRAADGSQRARRATRACSAHSAPHSLSTLLQASLAQTVYSTCCHDTVRQGQAQVRQQPASAAAGSASSSGAWAALRLRRPRQAVLLEVGVNLLRAQRGAGGCRRGGPPTPRPRRPRLRRQHGPRQRAAAHQAPHGRPGYSS